MADGDFRFEVNGFDSYDLRLGEELRGERATLGKSLLNVQKDLRIKAAYIAAIENCDVNAFPNKGFIAGYVRSYARYLNLNPEIIFERFCLESGYSNSIHNKALKIYKPSSERNSNNVLVNSQLDWRPTGVAFNEEMQYKKNKLLIFFAPLLLILVLGFGVAYGGWKILIDIQKLRIVPADNLPAVVSDFKLDSAKLVTEKEKQESIYFSEFLETVDIQLGEVRNTKSPEINYRDGPIANIKIEDVGLLGLNTPRVKRNSYTEQNKVAKKVTIKSIEISEFLGLDTNTTIDKTTQTGTVERNISVLKGYSDPLELEKNINFSQYRPDSAKKLDNEVASKINNLDLNIFAVKPSWIRIKDEEKNVVFEKILKSGEVLKIKKKWLNGNLRAGNAVDLFFSLDGITYGPVSDTRKVIKKFKIDPDYIFETLKINHLKDSFLNKSLSLRNSL